MSEPTDTNVQTSIDPRLEMIETLSNASARLARKMFQDEAGQHLSPSQVRQLGQLLVDLGAMEQELIFHVLKDDRKRFHLRDQ